MDIKDIKNLYGKAPQIGALMKLLKDNTVGNIFLKGLSCSATPVIFSALSDKLDNTFIFILQDADEAGYLYHDLMQIINSDNVLFFPSGYKRAAKHGQRDSANEILRTEVLAKVASHNNTSDALFIVSYPDALAELVVSKKGLDERRLSLKRGQNIDITDVEHLLREYGFTEVDYVYEPGQFA
ncbi:MAG: transcription-repair coupling factor, partial [Prevotella sp.]|nr:transcription-repair coupling factor [Prevotella sp.]